MADISNKNWIVDPSNAIEKKWIECQIQERKSRIVRLNQDIEDLKKGKIISLEAEIMMLDKELKKLEEKYGAIDKTINL